LYGVKADGRCLEIPRLRHGLPAEQETQGCPAAAGTAIAAAVTGAAAEQSGQRFGAIASSVQTCPGQAPWPRQRRPVAFGIAAAPSLPKRIGGHCCCYCSSWCAVNSQKSGDSKACKIQLHRHPPGDLQAETRWVSAAAGTGKRYSRLAPWRSWGGASTHPTDCSLPIRVPCCCFNLNIEGQNSWCNISPDQAKRRGV
jgi:hypothetical protein